MRKFTLRSGWHLCCCMLMLLMTQVNTVHAKLQVNFVTGKIVDANGNGIAGATIKLLSSTNATSSDANGVYRLNDVAIGNQTVVVNAIGYQTAQKNVLLRANANTVDIQLSSTTEDLDEVVVIGYGVAKKKQITGSISSVGAEEFNRGVVSSPDQLLAGKVAGLTVNRSGGDPTAGATVQLRGPSSLTAISSQGPCSL